MKRREFIEVTGISSLAIFCTSAKAFHDSEKDHAIFEDATVPVLKKCDVLVVGGGFAGVSSALAFSKAGKKVVLVERRIYLGREVTGEYRPWLEVKNSHSALPEAVKTCIDPKIKQTDNEKILLRPDHVKKSLENILFKYGVEIVYASNIMELIANGDKLQGVVIGNKSGRQAILSKLVLDCTETASAAHLTSQQFEVTNGKVEYIRTLEYTNIAPAFSKTINVPSTLGIKNNEVFIHQGYLGKGHCYIDCPMEFINPKFDSNSVVMREAEAWERSIEVAKYLYQHIPDFKNAYLTNSSYHLHGMYTPRMTKSNYAGERRYLNENIQVLNEKVILESFATLYANLFCISEAAFINKKQSAYLSSPVGACEIATSVTEMLAKLWSVLAMDKLPELLSDTEELNPSDDKPKIKLQHSPQKGKLYGRIKINNKKIPLVDEVDVLVAGGGTSGSPAAYTAAKEGKKTLVVDMNPGFGGTGTFGGVDSYWGPGDYYGLTASHIKKTTEINNACSKAFKDNGYGLWSIESKMAMWLREIRQSGAQILWNSMVVGVIVEGTKVVGVVVSTPQGVVAIKSKVVIDATGDGDIAAFAGASFILGSEHNNVPIWYAIRRQARPGPTQSIFQSTVDVTNIEDYTRSVHVGLRTGGDDLHDHQPYLAPRESRHIYGDVIITLTDLLKFRQWEDVISIHRSNTDMKGYHASDWFRIGLIPPNLSIEIPYRALLPQRIDNIIISGKAISVSHDCFPAIRMQHDLENLGGIAALAAVEAIEGNVSVRKIDVGKLQHRLVQADLLPQKVLEREINVYNYSEDELRDWINRLNPDVSLKSFGNTEMSELRTERIPFVEVCASSPERIIPILKSELIKCSGKVQLRIALALAMLGDDSGAAILLSEIKKQISNQASLPVLKEHIQHSGNNFRTPPDQGAAPICANLIYALGMTRSQLNVISIGLVSEYFKPESLDDFRLKDKALFFYIDAVSYAADLLGSKEAIPFLRKIRENEFLKNRSLKAGIEEDFILERLALMELILGRALARSGSSVGYEVLIEYLDDMRAVLAEFAHSTLSKISNHDFGKVKENWAKWLEDTRKELSPIALNKRPYG